MCQSSIRTSTQVPLGLAHAVPTGHNESLIEVMDEGEEASVEFFEKWQEDVVSTVPKGRLLVFDSTEGWGPLCNFLGVDVPENPYPKINSRAEKKDEIGHTFMLSYLVVFGIPVGLIIAAYLLLPLFGFT